MPVRAKRETGSGMRRRYAAGMTAIGAVAGYIQLARRRQLGWGATGQESDGAAPRRRPHREPRSHRDPRHHRPRLGRPGLALDRPAGAGAGRVLQLRLPGEPGRLRHPQRGSHRPRVAGHQGRGQGQARTRDGRSTLPPSSRGDRSSSAAGFRWGTPRLPTTSPGPSCSASSRTGRRRLLVRERYAYTRRWAPFLVEPAEAVSFVMTQKMLRGIRDRAESNALEIAR